MNTHYKICKSNTRILLNPKEYLRCIAVVFIMVLMNAGFLIESPGQSNSIYKFGNAHIAEQDAEEIKAVNGLMLDSVYEEVKLDEIMEFHRSHYYYDNQLRRDSVVMSYYNEDGDYQLIREIWTYNDNEQLIKWVKQEADFFNLPFTGDSTLYDSSVEEYEYENGKLILKRYTSSYGSVTEELFFYNEAGLPERDSILFYYDDGISATCQRYFYDSEMRLAYIVFLYNENYTDIGSYYYENPKPEQLLTTIKYANFYETVEVYDTITHWYEELYYLETFDEEGRRIELESHRISEFDILVEPTKVIYTYNDLGKRSLVSYFGWVEEEDSGYWEEVMRQKYQYGEQGQLLKYEKVFYDEKTGNWELEHGKDYYYTSIITDVNEEMAKTGRISLYPNPAGDYLIIQNQIDPSDTYKIYNLEGQMICRGDLNRGIVDVSSLSTGIYLFVIQTEKENRVGRFVKY